MVILKELEEGDLVLIYTARTETKGKIEPKLEGPYIIIKKTYPNSHSSNIVGM